MRDPFRIVLACAIAVFMMAGMAGAASSGQLTVSTTSSRMATIFNETTATTWTGTLMGPAATITYGDIVSDAGVKCAAATNTWWDTDREALIFDISGLPAGATVTAATLDIPGNNKYNHWDNNPPTFGITGFTPVTAGSIGVADFQRNGTTRYNTADISYANLDSTNRYGYNVFTLNPAGLAAIVPGKNYANFMVRASYDIDSHNPGWGSQYFAYWETSSYSAGAPRLTITYTTPGSVPTTAPTTVPTTIPTTVPTTAPTTVPTTVPTTPASGLLLASFSSNVTGGNAPLAVRFSDTSTGSPDGWSWLFGDGTGSWDQNPVHLYTAAGTYPVSLLVMNDYGLNVTTRAGYITVTAPFLPVAGFTATPTSGTAPLTVRFTDTSSGSPGSWIWSFGDGSGSAAQNPVHVYTAAGTYMVSLTVANGNGSNSLARPGYISVTAPVPGHGRFRFHS
ncbi:MAG TPA: PKD domain-containing protein [Methanoregula sp.]|nr:PKD domain-containing protein [Methanoregula sp.]